MPIELKMPALSPTMEEGTLAKWLVKEGDEVKSGDILAEIETDKATMEFEAVDEGRVGKILVPEGTEGVKVNQPIAVLLAEGEDASAAPSQPAPAKKESAKEAPPVKQETHAGAINSAMQSIPTKDPVVFITASYEGQPPDNAAHFFEWLSSLKGSDLDGVNYAVFGCGHRE